MINVNPYNSIFIKNVTGWNEIDFNVAEGNNEGVIVTVYNSYPPEQNYFNLISTHNNCIDLIEFENKNPIERPEYMKYSHQLLKICNETDENKNIDCEMTGNTISNSSSINRKSFERMSCPCDYAINDQCFIDASSFEVIEFVEDIDNIQFKENNIIEKLLFKNKTINGLVNGRIKEFEIENDMNIKINTNKSKETFENNTMNVQLDKNKITYKLSREFVENGINIHVSKMMNDITIQTNTYFTYIETNNNKYLKQAEEKEIEIVEGKVKMNKAGIIIDNDEENNKMLIVTNTPTDIHSKTIYEVDFDTKQLRDIYQQRIDGYKKCPIKYYIIHKKDECFESDKCLYTNNVDRCERCNSK